MTAQVPVTTSSTVQQAPWAGLIPYLGSNMSEAQRLYNLGNQAYTPWGQVADQTPDQIAALKGIRDYVNAPGTQGLLQFQSGLVSGLLSGNAGYNPQMQIGEMGAPKLAGYVGNNALADPTSGITRLMYQNTTDPSLVANIGQALDSVGKNLASAHGVQGFGAQIADNAHTLNQNNAVNSLFGHAYDTQQTNKLKGIQLGNNWQNNQAGIIADLLNAGDRNKLQSVEQGLNGFDSALKTPLSLLGVQGAAGDQQQAYDQAQLTDATNRFNFDQAQPWQNLARYSDLVSPIASMGKTITNINTSPPVQQGNKLMGAAGGLMAGAGAGASVGGVYGAVIGGAAGAAMGYFSK